MQWIDGVVSAAQTLRQEGEVIVSSGASPSGTYHFGHLRELVTCDAIVMALQRTGRQAKHIHVVDDLDALRKIPVNIPAEYEQFLGMPLCDVPAPDGSERSYAAFFVEPFIDAVRAIGVDVEVIYASERYRSGFYVPAIERALDRIAEAKRSLEEISGRQLDEHWTPVQIMKDGRLKNRSYVGIDTEKKVVFYSDEAGIQQEARYDTGEVKIDWRLDWPGRWWLMQVAVEPFGRDHATKGGAYDTGAAISRSVYGNEPPVPVPYDFINRTGDTKKMSASKGTGVHAHEVTQTLPAEVIRYFMLRYAPSKRLFFDEHATLMSLERFADPGKLPLPQEWVQHILGIMREQHLSFVEFNPLVVRGDNCFVLDAAVLGDSAAENRVAWTNDDVVDARQLSAAEQAIAELNENSPAAFSFRVLNPDGALWLLLSGGGASITIADEAQNHGKARLIGNYGEYSGGPTTEETYLYTKEVLDQMFRSKAPKKALVITGGVANFTDVKKTFAGVIQALDEVAERCRKEKIKVFVRRGGPNEVEGLAMMERFLEENKLFGSVHGSDIVLTEIINEALEYVDA